MDDLSVSANIKSVPDFSAEGALISLQYTAIFGLV
jgi:hypothetical protein